MKLSTVLVVFVLVFFGVLVGTKLYRLSPLNDQMVTSKKSTNVSKAIVRLHDLSTGRFFCTGFVVSPRLIVTAAHCLDGRPNDLPTIAVMDYRLRTRAATAHSYEQMADLGLVRGDFSNLPSLKITVAPMLIDSRMTSGQPLVSYGFPLSGPLIRAPFQPVGKDVFKYTGYSVMYPGMSGGPIFDEIGDSVIALNSGAMGGITVVSPLTNICSVLNCIVESP